jgi:hypothetical protein
MDLLTLAPSFELTASRAAGCTTAAKQELGEAGTLRSDQNARCQAANEGSNIKRMTLVVDEKVSRGNPRSPKRCVRLAPPRKRSFTAEDCGRDAAYCKPAHDGQVAH